MLPLDPADRAPADELDALGGVAARPYHAVPERTLAAGATA